MTPNDEIWRIINYIGKISLILDKESDQDKINKNLQKIDIWTQFRNQIRNQIKSKLK